MDLSPATVVTLYLLPGINVRLRPQLEKLRPGSRIVSHDFDMQGVIPDGHWTITAPEFVNERGLQRVQGRRRARGQEALQGARARHLPLDGAAEEVPAARGLIGDGSS